MRWPWAKSIASSSFYMRDIFFLGEASISFKVWIAIFMPKGFTVRFLGKPQFHVSSNLLLSSEPAF